jgi:hypothetical protein
MRTTTRGRVTAHHSRRRGSAGCTEGSARCDRRGDRRRAPSIFGAAGASPATLKGTRVEECSRARRQPSALLKVSRSRVAAVASRATALHRSGEGCHSSAEPSASSAVCAAPGAATPGRAAPTYTQGARLWACRLSPEGNPDDDAPRCRLNRVARDRHARVGQGEDRMMPKAIQGWSVRIRLSAGDVASRRARFTRSNVASKACGEVDLVATSSSCSSSRRMPLDKPVRAELCANRRQ